MAPADRLEPPRGWHRLARPRLEPPPPAQRGWLFRGLSLLARRFGRTEVPALFPVLNIHRGLFPAWLWFASRLMPYGRLPGAVRELLILRTAWNCRCRYEWGQHVELGLQAGLRDADILATTRDASRCADADQRLLLEACDELCRDDTLGDATWAALRAGRSDADVIEIVMLVGHYRMLAGLLNTAGLELEAPIEDCVQELGRRIRA